LSTVSLRVVDGGLPLVFAGASAHRPPGPSRTRTPTLPCCGCAQARPALRSKLPSAASTWPPSGQGVDAE